MARVPAAIGDFLILKAVRESGDFAIAVDDSAIESARTEVAQKEGKRQLAFNNSPFNLLPPLFSTATCIGLLLCPEGAATFAAFKQALAQGLVKKTETVLLFNCASGLKYPMPEAGEFVDRHKPIDYAKL